MNQRGYHTGSKRWRADLRWQMAQIQPLIPLNLPIPTLGAINETPAIDRETGEAMATDPPH